MHKYRKNAETYFPMFQFVGGDVHSCFPVLFVGNGYSTGILSKFGGSCNDFVYFRWLEYP